MRRLAGKVGAATAVGALLISTSPVAFGQSAFTNWSAIARAQPVSPATAVSGDHVLNWTGPDGQAVNLVVKEPSPVQGAPTVTVGYVAPGADARPAFDAAVAQAISTGAGQLVIPAGTYTFLTLGYASLGHWVIRGLHDVTINGTGATLVFTQNTTGVYIAGSQRLKLTGVNINYSMPLASLATVTSQGGQNVLVVDPAYPMTSGIQIGHVSDYNPATHEWVQGGKRLYFPTGSSTAPVYIGNQTFTSSAFRTLTPGESMIAFHHYYGGVAVTVKDIAGQSQSQDIILDGIGIHGGPGMGVVATKMLRGFALLNSHITPPPDGSSLVSTEYDAVHTLAVSQGDILIQNNTISGNGDDGVNFDSPVQSVMNVSADGLTIQITNYSRFYNQGDNVAFFDTTGTMIGQATLATQPVSIGNSNVQVTLNAAVPGVVPGMAMRDANQLPARVAMINNTVSDCQCHGVLVEIPHGWVSGNQFNNTAFNAVRLITNVGQWNEGVGAFNELFQNNTISNTGPDSSLAFPFGAISVYGVASGSTVSSSPMNDYINIASNTVSNTAQACIAVASALDVTVQGNTCSANNLKSPGQPAIVVQSGAQITVTGNTTQ